MIRHTCFQFYDYHIIYLFTIVREGFVVPPSIGRRAGLLKEIVAAEVPACPIADKVLRRPTVHLRPPQDHFCLSKTDAKMVVREGFEPSKAYAARFTVWSIWPLWYLTKSLYQIAIFSATHYIIFILFSQ